MMMTPQLLPDDFLNQMAEIIKLIGHPQRLRILEFLDIHGESPVGMIVEGIKAPQGAVSQQLNRMRMAGIISCRRDGRQVLYQIAAVNAITILNCLREKYKKMKMK
ncbi:MAG: metalloregulator ArsR/SmtB family transcription factor [Bacilli bacterium]|jgi:DNA-binding transcriptional ArsR family regulator